MANEESVLDFIFAHNQPEQCPEPCCPFCEAWDVMTTDEFTQALPWLLGQQTEATQ